MLRLPGLTDLGRGDELTTALDEFHVAVAGQGCEALLIAQRPGHEDFFDTSGLAQADKHAGIVR